MYREGPAKPLNLNLLWSLNLLLIERNVTSAADRAGITQSAMSHTLKQLRAYFQDELLVKGERGFVLTPKAEKISGRLQQGLEIVGQAIDAETEFVPETSNRLFTIATSDFLSALVMPSLAALTAERAPNTRFRFTSIPEHLDRALETGRVDLVIGSSIESRLAKRKRLFADQFVCVVRQDHPALQKPFTKSRYLEMKHIDLTSEPGVTSAIMKGLGARAGDRTVATESPFTLSAPLVVSFSHLVLTAPRLLTYGFSDVYPVSVLVPPFKMPPLSVEAAWHPRMEADPTHIWLRDIVTELGDLMQVTADGIQITG